MLVKTSTLNSFAKTITGGNPAGVVLNADNLSEEQMQSIAKKVGFSETAFVMNSDKADFRLRFFTPTDEVDLCGHATIAAFSLMFKNKIVTYKKYTQETKAGILGIQIEENGTIFMNQNLPEFFDELDKEAIADSLNIPIDFINNELPIQIVSTGLKDIIVPINTIEQLNSIKPDFDKISAINKKTSSVGYHLFTLETVLDSTANCRNFAPLYGINEESATGTSNGALACYLYKHNQLKPPQYSNLIFEQGYSMNKPSEILAKLSIANNEISIIEIGGSAIFANDSEVEI